MVRTVGLVVVLATALVVGMAAAVAAALLGHEVLVAIYGEDLAPIDDTLPMLLAVGTAYLAGGAAALAVLVLGWRRFVRRLPAGSSGRSRPSRMEPGRPWPNMRDTDVRHELQASRRRCHARVGGEFVPDFGAVTI